MRIVSLAYWIRNIILGAEQDISLIIINFCDRNEMNVSGIVDIRSEEEVIPLIITLVLDILLLEYPLFFVKAMVFEGTILWMPYSGDDLQSILLVGVIILLQSRHQESGERTPRSPGQINGIFVLADNICEGERLSVEIRYGPQWPVTRHIKIGDIETITLFLLKHTLQTVGESLAGYTKESSRDFPR